MALGSKSLGVKSYKAHVFSWHSADQTPQRRKQPDFGGSTDYFGGVDAAPIGGCSSRWKLAFCTLRQ
jgi:hypothetical protein